MMLVVNESDGASTAVSTANRTFAEEITRRFELIWQSKATFGLSLFRDPDSDRDILLVDRYSDGLRFPEKCGVGHARKAGADIATLLISLGRVSLPWIHCSDADVILPARYLSCVSSIEPEKTSALIYPFRHVPGGSTRVDTATHFYEFSLHYYVAGLQWAGSPYAFHTIGSTMAVNALHYARVRGFPRRQAGEDFYLLNKLAKVGKVLSLAEGQDCEAIEITSRISDRVPFGTGAATGRIAGMANPAHGFLLYHPAVFDELREWLHAIPAFWQAESRDLAEVLTSERLLEGLAVMKADQALAHAFRQSASLTQFEKQMHTWFDAFRTLKLIHFLRDNGLASVSYQSLVTEHEIGHLKLP